MKGLCAWVTAAVEEKDVRNVVRLAQSLKKSLTTNSLVLLLSPMLDSRHRKLLTKSFDQVICLDVASKSWIDARDYAKLYTFNLTLFRKCVYLNPEMIVIKNSDDVFDKCEHSVNGVCSHEGVDTSVICLTPSCEVFYHIVESSKSNPALDKEKASFDSYFKDWIFNQKGFGKLEEKYNFIPGTITEDFMEPFIINSMTINLFHSADLPLNGLVDNAKINAMHKNISKVNGPPADVLDSIAIVGLSCRHAGSNNFDEFWKLLINGQEGIQKVPSDRWTKEHGCKAEHEAQGGFLSDRVDKFDNKLFGISPKEMEFLDPQQRLLLEVCWEALENAAIDPLSLHGTHASVFLGAWMNDYKDIIVKNGCDEFYRIYMGNSFGAAAARLSFFLGLTGPSVATESGCSSAMVAVDLACKSLRNKETSLALACGVNLLLAPFNKDTMSFVIAADGRCKTFDESADGFGRAEGCGVLVLKRYTDAVKDGDNIWALIRGSSCVQEGVSRSMGTPTKECEALAMTLALKDANVHPNNISYLEAHGTGTPMGDPLEMAAIAEVYGKIREQPLIVGSVKTNVGHTESCSGITGILKVIASLQNEVIPPHLNLKTLNPKINLEAIPALIPMQPTPWPKTEGKSRLAGVSSFGITGTDGHVILQETPDLENNFEINNFGLERPMHVMKISGKTEEALDALLLKYQKLFEEQVENKQMSLKDIAYTANIGRASFNHRAVIVARDCQDAWKILAGKKYTRKETVEGQQEKICFLFTGQGSQYTGMAKELYDSCPVFRMNFDKCHKILEEKYSLNVKEALWGATSEEKLAQSLYSQTTIFCVEYCLLKVWESWGVTPNYVMGHSLGEFAASVAAKLLSLKDALMLVAERSRLVESLGKGKMLVVKADQQTVEAYIKGYTRANPTFWLDFAAINTNEQTVLAGGTGCVEAFAEFCSVIKKVKTHILDASHAFHSRLMDPILEQYSKAVGGIKGKGGTSCKYISGVYGKIIEDDNVLLDKQYWVDHTREKVHFIGACQAAVAEGCKYFLEIGPQPILSAFVLANSGGNGGLACLPSMRRGEDNWQTILNSLAKLYVHGWSVDWPGFDKYYSRSKLRLPTYPFQRKKFWFDVQNIGLGTLGNATSIHPLLGSIFPNASGAKIFQNGIDLKKLDYIKDHCVGKRIIFPGAGYLEMCLAAGHAVTEGLTDTFCRPSGPLTIEHLRISTPLALDEKQICVMQLVMDASRDEKSPANAPSDGTKMEVFRQTLMEGEAPKWVSHAISYFTPAPIQYDEIRFRDEYNFTQLRSACQVQVDISELYSKLGEIGLKFGDAFQSLTSIWKGECGILAEVKVPADFQNYIVHPVLLDAMIQAGMIAQSKGQPIEKLNVPIAIQKLTWLDNADSDKFFIYSSSYKEAGNSNNVLCVLFDESGKILGFMMGLEFAETTIQAMESLLESQEAELPPLQNEVWKSTMGPNQARVNLNDLFISDMFSSETLNQFNNIDSELWEWSREYTFNDFAYGFILNAFYELGWKPVLGSQFILDKLMLTCHIQPQFRKLVRFYLTILERNGIAKFVAESEVQIVKMPPTVIETHQVIQKAKRRLETFDNISNNAQIYSSIGVSLSQILQGKESALSILFPQDSSKPSAESFYSEAYSNGRIGEKVIEIFKRLLKGATDVTGTLRILEIGAGTGNFTGDIVKLMLDQGIDIEYTFSDISPAFFINAERKFESYSHFMKYQVFNIEEDAKCQGFSPGYFDIVVGADVVHATKDLSDSLSNLRQVIKPSGMLCLIEGAKPNHVTFVFGLLDGYWRFTDTNIRQHHPLVSGETWKQVCIDTGYDKIKAIPCADGFYTFLLAQTPAKEKKINRPITFSSTGKWLVFSSAGEVSAQFVHRLSLYRSTIQVWKAKSFHQSDDGDSYTINVNKKEHMTRLFGSVKGQNDGTIEGIVYLWGMGGGKHEQDEFAQPFLHLCQAVVEMKQQIMPKFFIITNGVFPIGDHLIEHPASSTLWGIGKSTANECNMRCKMIDVNPDENTDQIVIDAFHELWADHSDFMMAYRDKTRFVAKMMRTKFPEKALKLPQCDRFQLILPQSKAISDLKFGTMGKFTLKPDEICIRVKAAALNFRDVFAVMKPDAQFDNINVVGSDFAGVVESVGTQVTKWKLGDAVFGCNLEDGALPSHVRIVEDAVVKMPSKFTFAEAATLPAVFATAYYSLVTVAKMSQGDTVLIHTASGGVGLSAIQVAQKVGATIIATAGSARKRAYLRSLGVLHVFHSRNTKYEQDILKVTRGKGVDIVLNSLTGPGFKEASLNACAPNARFVEMSKLSIWKTEDVATLRPDVNYTIVDLASASRDVWKMLFETLDTFLKEDTVKSIPYVRFDGVHIREALTYLQKAKHIGKIVCIMPQAKFQAGHYSFFTPLFNPESTYVITGGLGGIGFEVMKWMVTQGAKYLVVVSRRQPQENHLQILKSLRAQNINIITQPVDVGDYTQCKRMIDFIQDPANNLPPLRGIMHCAGVLSDATLINQSWDKFLTVFRPKIKGTWNLHELTLNCGLEHFVLFSSMAAQMGPPGQSNHAAANAYLDSFAHFRQSIGLPAISINWGQWGQVGVVASKEVRGVVPFSPQRGIASLEATMKSQRTQISVFDFGYSTAIKVHPQSKSYLQYMANASSTDGSESLSIKSEKFWDEMDTAKEENRPGIIKHYVKIIMRQILKLDDDENIEDHTSFQDIGLDSLMMIELKNNLQTILGSRLTIGASALSDCNNIEALTDRLIAQMKEFGVSQSSENVLNPEELKTLIFEDSKLPESITSTGKQPPVKLTQAKTFLLTGVTGNLGPHILQEILTYPQVTTVYCLLRKSTNPLQRLQTVLKESFPEGGIDMTKVKVVIGDVTLPKLGMEDVEYDTLSHEIDAVIHCAVRSNHVEPYGMTVMRNVNVFGTVNVLEFASSKKLKHLFHSSSIVAVSSTSEQGGLSEDWPTPDELDGVTDLGYPISKMISDRLVHQAVERGMPCKSFRFVGLVGHSQTGRFKHLNNHFMMRFLCYMKLGAMPSIPTPSIFLPVDIAARTSLKVFFDEVNSPYDIYNVCHPCPALEQEFPVLAKEFGFDVDIVDYLEFVNRFGNEGEDSLLYPFKALYENEEKYNAIMSFPEVIRKWLENPDKFFRVDKVTKVIPGYAASLQPTWDYIRRDVQYAKETGLFLKFKLH